LQSDPQVKRGSYDPKAWSNFVFFLNAAEKFIGDRESFYLYHKHQPYCTATEKCRGVKLGKFDPTLHDRC